MRIVTWNMAGGEAKQKLSYLIDRLKPDVVALQEVARPKDGEFSNCIWHGPDRKGVLVWVKDPLSLKPFPKFKCPTQLYLPVRVFCGSRSLFDVYNNWVKPFSNPPAGSEPYQHSLQTAINAFRELRSRKPKVIIGDFNALGSGFKESICRALGRWAVSAYHEFHGVGTGDETHPTFRHKGSGNLHHLDMCFMPTIWQRYLRRVTVGSSRVWGKSSDHFPITVDVDDRAISN